MADKQWTPQDLKEYLLDPLNRGLFIFEFHQDQVLANLRAIGHNVTSLEIAQSILESFFRNEEFEKFMTAINVDLSFEGLPEEYLPIINEFKQK